jgi:hypothetical protein
MSPAFLRERNEELMGADMVLVAMAFSFALLGMNFQR